MSENMSKAQKRNLRQQVGSAAADVVASMKDTVIRLELANQVLARQMLEFETTASRLVESRAVDRKALEGMREQVESAHAKIGDERTHRLKLADEQRAYVDGADAGLRRLSVERGIQLADRIYVFEALTFLERLRWLFLGELPPARAAAPLAPYVARDAYEAAWTDLGRPADALEEHSKALTRLRHAATKSQHLGAVGGE